MPETKSCCALSRLYAASPIELDLVNKIAEFKEQVATSALNRVIRFGQPTILFFVLFFLSIPVIGCLVTALVEMKKRRKVRDWRCVLFYKGYGVLDVGMHGVSSIQGINAL